MGVCCWGFSVIVRNTVIAGRMAGGINGYKKLCPNGTLCTDGFICRIGFMHPEDAKKFVTEVVASQVTQPLSPDDFPIVHSALDILRKPDWLAFGNYKGIPIVCLKGTERATLFIPEMELDSKLETISIKDLKESYEFVEVRENVEHYVHKVTGRDVYIGRTQPLGQPAESSNDTDDPYKPHGWREAWKRIRSYFRQEY
jgi:hypothetical protein